MTFRFKKILLLSVLVFLSIQSFAQEKDWSFVDKTGIKGIQLSFGSELLNDPFFHQRILNAYVTEQPADSITILQDQNHKNIPSGKLQLVYAPFRFSSNIWLRNFELLGGLSFQNNITRRVRIASGYENTDTSGIYNKKEYKLSQKSGFATLGFQFNYPLGNRLMAYAGFGGGWGIFNGLHIESSGNEQTIYQDDSVNQKVIRTSYFTEPAQDFYQSKSYWQSNLLLGVKLYLTCRVNLYAEYGLQSIYFNPSGTEKYRQSSQFFQLGIRLKFNPPEPTDPEDEKKTPSAFW